MAMAVVISTEAIISRRVVRMTTVDTKLFLSSRHAIHFLVNAGARRTSCHCLSIRKAFTVRSEVVDDRESRRAAIEILPSSQELLELRKAADIVEEFYRFVNVGDYFGASDLFTDDCVYEDLTFSEPTIGRQELARFFEKVMTSMGSELKFTIDDITREDPSAVGVTWHLDWEGKKFPFSKGVSFYRCVIIDGQRKIKYARDAVEPVPKPGGVAMVAIKLITGLFRKFPQLIERL